MLVTRLIAAADQEWVDQEGRSMLAESELWRADLSWSCEAQTLRAMAIAAPDKLTEAVGHQTVQHLRITDKQVWLRVDYCCVSACQVHV